MSCVCILTPVVIAAWPAFSAAVTAAAVSLGYSVAEGVSEGMREGARNDNKSEGRVVLEVPRSEIVTEKLGRDQRIVVERDGMRVEFSRDARGRASICVSGDGYEKEELQAAGKELSRHVVQQFVYQRLMEEAQRRHMVVVEEEREANQSIRIKLRHWDS